MHTTDKNTETWVAANKEAGLQKKNAKQTKYFPMSRDQKAGRNHSIEIDNSSFTKLEDFKYLGTTLKNQNYIQE